MAVGDIGRDDLTTKASSAASTASAEAQSAASAASGKASSAAAHSRDAASGLYASAAESVQGLADRAPDRAAEAFATGQRVYAQGSAELGRHVSRQPIEALLLAGAIGYLVGWATSRG